MAFLIIDRRTLICGCVAVAAAFVLGVLIGYYGKPGDGGHRHTPEHAAAHAAACQPHHHPGFGDDEVNEAVKKVIASVNSTKLRKFHKELTKEPHIAALRRDKELVAWIEDEWRTSGLDGVQLASYDYLLSWPNQTNPNKIRLMDASGSVRFTSKHEEDVLRPEDAHPEFVHAFNAYAKAGTVSAPLVYVNYGRVEDFERLEELGVGVRGKICISRYGKIYRGNRLRNCQDAGGVGVIMFSDPEDVAIEGTAPENVYPNTIFLPGSGVQRGSTYIGEGDPFSPGFPSVPNAFRETDRSKIDGLPKIPSQPIGYDDAAELLRTMGGREPPSEWKGKIDGVDYKLGDEEHPNYKGWTVELSVHNYEETVSSANVIGHIRGDVEPDRYVLLSNHRDAWGYGSIDPSSGTAQLMEVARVLGGRVASGWRPRRTVVFASWAAEEYGLEGSYEFVMDKVNKVMQRSVGLINTDICTSGPIAKPQASPSLQRVVVEALKSVPDIVSDNQIVDGQRRSYFDFWREWNGGEQKVKLLGAGSDHAAFAFFAGVPAINFRLKDDTKKHKGVGQYPTYHTGYETFYLYDKIIDPGYKIMKTCAQSSLHMILNLADSNILPYDLPRLAEAMREGLDALDKNNVTKIIEEHGLTLKHLSAEVRKFSAAVETFKAQVEDVDDDDLVATRRVNDQLMQLERVFVLPRGLPGRPETRHALFSNAKFNSYGSSVYPGIGDLLHRIDKLEGSEADDRWSSVARHISDLMIVVRQATDFLEPMDKL